MALQQGERFCRLVPNIEEVLPMSVGDYKYELNNENESQNPKPKTLNSKPHPLQNHPFSIAISMAEQILLAASAKSASVCAAETKPTS